MKRTIALGAAWTASAAAAVGLGFLAVSLVDASASPARPVAASSTSATATSTGAPATPSATGQYATTAGTVFADCTSGPPVLAGVPAAGWSVDDSHAVGQMEFEAAGQKVEVRVACVGGAPVFSLDDSSAGSGSTPPAPATSSAGEDSSGRDGGGHGSDDGPGDDSSGRDGGGHGSDG